MTVAIVTGAGSPGGIGMAVARMLGTVFSPFSRFGARSRGYRSVFVRENAGSGVAWPSRGSTPSSFWRMKSGL